MLTAACSAGSSGHQKCGCPSFIKCRPCSLLHGNYTVRYVMGSRGAANDKLRCRMQNVRTLPHPGKTVVKSPFTEIAYDLQEFELNADKPVHHFLERNCKVVPEIQT